MAAPTITNFDPGQIPSLGDSATFNVRAQYVWDHMAGVIIPEIGTLADWIEVQANRIDAALGGAASVIDAFENLPAENLTGTIDKARLPALDAADVTTGVFDVARIPTLTPAKLPSEAVQTGNLGARLAAMPHLAVGTQAWLVPITHTGAEQDLQIGDILPGSALAPAGVFGTGSVAVLGQVKRQAGTMTCLTWDERTALPGSWRLLGACPKTDVANGHTATLGVRIA